MKKKGSEGLYVALDHLTFSEPTGLITLEVLCRILDFGLSYHHYKTVSIIRYAPLRRHAAVRANH